MMYYKLKVNIRPFRAHPSTPDIIKDDFKPYSGYYWKAGSTGSRIDRQINICWRSIRSFLKFESSSDIIRFISMMSINNMLTMTLVNDEGHILKDSDVKIRWNAYIIAKQRLRTLRALKKANNPQRDKDLMKRLLYTLKVC